MIFGSNPNGRNCWTVTATYRTRPDKPIAEIKLSKGEYAVTPLVKMTKAESSMVACLVDLHRSDAAGDPHPRSAEARLGRIDAALTKLSEYFEDRGGPCPEFIEKLDAAGEKVREVAESLRRMRAA